MLFAASPTTDKTTSTTTERVVTETIATPAELVERMLAAAQRTAEHAAADVARTSVVSSNARVDHPASPAARTEPSRQAALNINEDVNMLGGAGSDVYAMLISRPCTPIPPLSITDDFGTHRLSRSCTADDIFDSAMANIRSRVAANMIDVDMNTPGSTPHAPRIAAANFDAEGTPIGPATAFDNPLRHAAPSSPEGGRAVRSALNHTHIGAAPNGPQSATIFTTMGTAIDSGNAGGTTGPNIVGGGAGPSIAGPSRIVADGGNEPPPPYSERTNALPPAVAQPSRSRLASSHSRRRVGRVAAATAAAASSARANQPGSASFPIPVDD